MNILQHILPYLKYYFASSTKYDVHSPFLYDFITKVLEDKTDYKAYVNIKQLCNTLSSNNDSITVEDFGAGSVFRNAKQKKVSALLKNTAYNGKYGKLLFRIAQYYKPENIIELGTGLGVATAYMALANSATTIITVEGSTAIANIAKENFKKLNITNIEVINAKFDDVLLEILQKRQKIDLVFIDGNHQQESTIKYFNAILPYCHNNTIVIFDDIRWSNGMFNAWQEIIKNKQITLSLDLYKTGIVFFKSEIKVKQHFFIRY